VAGTGSIAYGLNGRNCHVRCGGWDEFFSDEGSAYWIARRGMELFSKQSDGRAPEGPLLKLIRKEFELARDIDFIDCMYKRLGSSREGRASFQILMEKAALLGDRAVSAIYGDAAVELNLMAQTVRRLLDLPPDGWRVSYSGGVFKAGDLILKPLKSLIEAGGGILCRPEHSPVRGALLMALDKFTNLQ